MPDASLFMFWGLDAERVEQSTSGCPPFVRSNMTFLPSHVKVVSNPELEVVCFDLVTGMSSTHVGHHINASEDERSRRCTMGMLN
jgi:hypothetical protein